MDILINKMFWADLLRTICSDDIATHMNLIGKANKSRYFELYGLALEPEHAERRYKTERMSHAKYNFAVAFEGKNVFLCDISGKFMRLACM